jgi:hypothetical protein
MTERWRRSLDALGRSEPEVDDLRQRALRGPRLADPPRRKGSALVAGALSLSIALASFGVLRNAFREGPERPPVQPPSQAEPARLDPEEVCDVPAYDPNVAILGDRYDPSAEPFVGLGEFPIDILEVSGEPAATIAGPAADELRRFLDSGDGRNAPSDGWRAISESHDEVIFAAPHDGHSDWWIVRFVTERGAWRFAHVQLVDQHLTPAQLGRGLRLGWTGEVVFDQGRWDSTLTLTNERGASWSVGEDGYELWGDVHVFDPATGEEVGHAARTVGPWVPSPHLGTGANMRLPLSLGGAVPELAGGASYDLVACVPELGLASPAGTLRVEENTIVRSVRVLTYPFTGSAMQALAIGRLTAASGCLGLTGIADDLTSYVIWPDGFTMVYRDGAVATLIDSVGREVAQLGEGLSLGGGHVGLEHIEGGTIGGIPDACRRRGESYFVTSGSAQAG